jgi:glycosyltransferase involved in cell wall biosynthesis
MKIVLVTESYWPNVDGGAVFEHHLTLGLAQRGHDVTVLTASPKGPYEIAHDRGSRIVRLPSYLFLFNKLYRFCIWPRREIHAILDEFKPDIIHVHTPSAISYITLRWAHKHDTPVLATNHFIPDNFSLCWPWLGPFTRLFDALLWRYLIWFYNQCPQVTSPTVKAVDLLKQHGLKPPASPVSNGIDTNIFCPGTAPAHLYAKYGIPQNKPIVYYTGRLDGEKRMDIWVEMIPLVLAQRDCHFVIGGNGTRKNQLEQRVADLGVADRVTFTGFVPEEELPDLYRMAAVFVITSPAELQSIVTLEALATGLPVVACDKLALRDLVHDNENGFLCTYEDSRDTADKVLAILSDPRRAKHFSQQSRLIAGEHSFDHTVSSFIGHYQHLIKATSS